MRVVDEEDEDDDTPSIDIPRLRELSRACNGIRSVGSDNPKPPTRRAHIENMLATFDDDHYSDAIFDSAITHARYFESSKHSATKRRGVDSVTLERIDDTDDVKLTAVFRSKR